MVLDRMSPSRVWSRRTTRSRKRLNFRVSYALVNYLPEVAAGFSAGPSLPSHKQHPRRRKGMCSHCFSHYVVVLTWLRQHSIRKSSTNHPHPLENGNESKKNKKLYIPFLEAKSSLLRSSYKPRLRVVSTRKNHVRCRRVKSARAVLTHLSIGSRLESGEKSISNRIAKSERISRGASHQKNRDEGIGYRNISQKSYFQKCRLLSIRIIFSRGPR